MIQGEHLVSEYAYILRDYLQEQREAKLNRLSSFARKLVEEDSSPEITLAVHLEVVRHMMKEATGCSNISAYYSFFPVSFRDTERIWT